MEADKEIELRKWIDQKFDRVDDRLSSILKDLKGDIEDSRHMLRPSIQQTAEQVVVVTEVVNAVRGHVDSVSKSVGTIAEIANGIARKQDAMSETVNTVVRRVDAIDQWREDEGPLDQRFKRHSNKQTEQELWRAEMRGGLRVASIFIPLVTAITSGIVVGAVVFVIQLTGPK